MSARCALCPDYGAPAEMLEQTIDGRTTYMHGRCFIQAFGTPAFMALPPEQTGRLTLEDIGLPMAKALLAERAAALLAKRAVAELMSNGVLDMLRQSSGEVMVPRK